MRIQVQFTNGIKEIEAPKGKKLLDVLLSIGANIDTDCGGRGRCNKCKVKILNGDVDGTTISESGEVLSCLAYIKEDLVVQVNSKLEDKLETEKADKIEGNFSIAFDLGTTTLAFSLVDTKAKKVVETYTVLNKQSVYGADVISRISAASEGNLQNLYEIITGQLNECVKYFKTKYNIEVIEKVVVAANTTMLHLFTNTSPKSIGVAPYKPVFLEHKTYLGKELNVDSITVDLLPGFSSFVGADITSGVYSLGLENDSILIDLGTNGEIVYRSNDNYYGTSTAAGPCLEGATIECGIGGVNGAISKFEIVDGKKNIKTIADKKPVGICGAGLVDIIASLLDSGYIDMTGALKDDMERYDIVDDIYLSKKDVREFQLAKSAICSGIQALLIDTGKDINEIKKFYLAGGIGYHINIDNAIRTGILPKEAQGKVFVAGNSSLEGAIKCLLNEDALEKMVAIASECEILELNSSKTFTDGYVMNMFFE